MEALLLRLPSIFEIGARGGDRKILGGRAMEGGPPAGARPATGVSMPESRAARREEAAPRSAVAAG